MDSNANANSDHLQTDMGQFLKRIKQREQEHRKFFEYNNKINSRWSQIADDIFIHDQLSKLRIFIQQKLAFQYAQQELDAQMCSRYEHIYTCSDPVILLMKRVTMRVVEIAQFGLEPLKDTVQYYTLSFTKFKTACLRASSDGISCRPANIIKVFSRYWQHKMSIEVDRLKEIIKFLQLSDFKSLQGLKEVFYRKLCLRELSNLSKKQSVNKQPSRIDTMSTSPLKLKKQVASIHSQKQIRIKLTKVEVKQKEKLRRLEVKRLKKYVHSLCQVMDVNKDQLLEDVFIQNKEFQSRRIYTELTGRNKFNLAQIQDFSEKSPAFYDALDRNILEVKPIYNNEDQFLFEKKMLSQIQKIQVKKPVRIEVSAMRTRISPTKNEKQQNGRYSKRESFNTKSRTIYKKQRKTVNNVQQFNNLKEKQTFQSSKQSPGEFIQINIKTQQHKQRLPEIGARATSVDTVKILKKQAQLKLLKDQKIKKQQLQLARNAQQQTNQVFSSKKNDQIGVSHSNIQKSKGRQKIQSKIKLQLKTMGSNFFEQIGKRISKFCEMKKNLVV